MLVAILVVAMVVLTGVSVSSAVGAVVRAARGGATVARGGEDRETEGAADVEDNPTDPFGRALGRAGGPIEADPDPEPWRSWRTQEPVEAATAGGPEADAVTTTDPGPPAGLAAGVAAGADTATPLT